MSMSVSSQGARSLAGHGAEEAPAEWPDRQEGHVHDLVWCEALRQQWDAFCMLSAPSLTNPTVGQRS